MSSRPRGSVSRSTIYSPLGSNNQHIRLLHVDTSTHRHGRSYNEHRLLTNIALNSRRIKYVALSYVWGKRKEKQITVEGIKIDISTNLALALDKTIAYWNTTYPNQRDDLYLWIDQICIDQTNNEEKSHQVSLMAKIYQRADEVLVWLPLSRTVQNDSLSPKAFIRWMLDSADSDVPAAQKPVRTLYGLHYFNPTYPHTEPVPVSLPDWTEHGRYKAWSNIHAIIASSWWERAWTYQEFVFSDRATFLISNTWLHWQSMFTLILHYSDRRDESVKEFCALMNDELGRLEIKLSQPVRNTPTLWTRVSGLWRYDPDQHVTKQSGEELRLLQNAIKEQIGLIEQFQRHHDSCTDHWRRVRHVLEHRDLLRMELYQPMSLSELLQHSWTCKASDDRDKVYAFVNMTSTAYEIIPDYSLSVVEVYIETAKALIRHDRNLKVLDIALETAKFHPTKDILPSWVPNWAHQKGAVYDEFLRNIGLDLSKCNASKGRLSSIRFDQKTLHMQAIMVDRLTQVMEETPSTYVRKFATRGSLEITTTIRARRGDEVWLLLGTTAPLVLRRQDNFYIVFGHAMIWDNEVPSAILDGSLITALDAMEVSLENISIV